MSEPHPTAEFLVLSRGHWNPDASPADIQAAIDRFYEWYSRNLESGRLKPGSRLGTAGATVSQSGIVMDGPFGEAKEVIGGYWIIVAPSLESAAAVAAENPCLPFGLRFEIRPLEAARASAFHITNETPSR